MKSKQDLATDELRQFIFDNIEDKAVAAKLRILCARLAYFSREEGVETGFLIDHGNYGARLRQLWGQTESVKL